MNKRFYILLALLCLWYSAVARAGSDEVLTLQAAVNGDFYLPGESLQVVLPSELNSAKGTVLIIELDGIDLSAVVEREAGMLRYTPVRRLHLGVHELRVMFYQDNGDVRELGYWQFEVRQSAAFRDARMQGQFDLAVSQRVAASALYGGDSSSNNTLAAQGGGRVLAQLEGNDWQLDAAGDVALSNSAEHSLTGRTLDVPTFSVVAATGRYRIEIGDHQNEAIGLLSNGYQQRGLSASMVVNSLDSAVKLYSVSANQRIGLEGGLGLSESNNRIDGVNWLYQPLNNDSHQLVVSSSFMSGRVSESDFATLEPGMPSENRVNGGQAWNLSADGELFERQVRVRIEQARSRYDFDGEARGFEAINDQAWSTLMVFQPLSPPSQESLSINIGLEAREVGSYFYSLLNKNQIADQSLRRIFANMAYQQWYWDAVAATEHNNVDNNHDYARTDNTHWNVSGGYRQQLQAGWLLTLLGQPSYHASMGAGHLEDVYTPAGYIANNLSVRKLNANIDFAHAKWQWSMGYKHDEVEDYSGWQDNTRSQALQLNAQWQWGQQSHLGVGWELQETDYHASGDSTRRQLLSFDAQAEIIPERLSALLSIGVNQSDALNDPFFAQRNDSGYASGNIIWRIREAENNFPGLDLTFTVLHNHYDDHLNAVNNSQGYQAFIKLSSSLPTALPGES